MSTLRRARQQSVGDIPRRTAGRFPNKTAIVDGDTRLTFAEFDERIDRVAAALTEEGFGKGDTLALLSRNCWQFPVLTFATARIGMGCVPINFMLTDNEIAYILDHSEATAFVVGQGLTEVADRALGLSERRVRLTASIGSAEPLRGWSSVEDWMGRHGVVPDVAVDDDDPIRLMYTSGTESRPKGAVLSSRSLMWQYMSCIVSGEMHAEDVEVHALPLYHCAQLDNFLSTDIYLGATSIILDGPNIEVLLRTIESERVTNLFGPPTVWIDLLRSPLFERTDLSSLRKGYYGASPMPVEILAEMTERLPNVSLWNLYGQTEMASVATVLGPADQVSHAGSAGRPALNVETRIVDEHDHPLPSGEVGEIVHRSPQATSGYFRAPEKTAEAFRGGWFHSGDLGYLDTNGYLYVVDRKKDMIKSGGENVATREVEEVLYQMDSVAEAAVFGIAHPRWIEAVAATVVPRAGRHLTDSMIIDFCRTRLAGYKVPKVVHIVDSLPKNPSGKILKRALRDEFGTTVKPEIHRSVDG
ncbi:MAG: acyl-CoA synthetase [Rhodococcus erythropolis]|nr:fatty acyl-CoA synthetase [Rhodococcus erythropolis]MDF2894196.1 acyl-CoA synthetase [Rhodococcus erythropolis]